MFDTIARLIDTHCPDGVEYKRLGDFVTLKSGKGLSKSDLSTEGIPAIHYSEISTKYKSWAIESFSFVENILPEYNVTACKNDVVMSVTGWDSVNIGYSVAWLGDSPIIVGGDNFIIKHSQNAKYLSYYFNSKKFKKFISEISSGSIVFHVNRKKFLDLEVPLPPIEIQNKIAEILEPFVQLEMDIEREIGIRNIQYSELCKRLLRFDNCKLVDLSNFANVSTGKRNTVDKSTTGTYPFYVRGEDVYSFDTYDHDEDAVLTPGDGDVGKVIHYVSGKYAAHQRVYRITLKNNNLYNLKFLYYYMNNKFNEYINSKAFSGTVKSLRKPMLESFQIPLVCVEDQNALVEKLDKLEDLIYNLKQEIELRRKQFDYYREQLFSF